MTLISSRGQYFQDFEVGQVVESPARTVTEADIIMFAGLSGDYNQLHTDAEFCKGTAFGQRIAHGLLGLSIASGLAARCGFIEGTAEAFVGLEWKFKAPVFIGDTVRLCAEITRTRAVASMGGGMVSLAVRLLNQHDKIVQQGEWTMLMKGRPAA